jgi:hypothetical protein
LLTVVITLTANRIAGRSSFESIPWQDADRGPISAFCLQQAADVWRRRAALSFVV